MGAIKRGRLSKQAWSEVMRRFEGAGATVKRFCAQEGLSTQSFYRWRGRLAGGSEMRTPTPKTSALIRPPRCETSSFIELGELPGAAAPAHWPQGLSCAWSWAAALCCKS
ncbi:transposase [Polaromonas sp. P1-6]|nr:transposase [Polaromonas sp. P1-6]